LVEGKHPVSPDRTVRVSGRGCAARILPESSRLALGVRTAAVSRAIHAGDRAPSERRPGPVRADGSNSPRVRASIARGGLYRTTGTAAPAARHHGHAALVDEADRRGAVVNVVMRISVRSENEADGYERVVRSPDPPKAGSVHPVPARYGYHPHGSLEIRIRTGRSTPSGRTRTGTKPTATRGRIRFIHRHDDRTRRTPAARSPRRRRPAPGTGIFVLRGRLDGFLRTSAVRSDSDVPTDHRLLTGAQAMFVAVHADHGAAAAHDQPRLVGVRHGQPLPPGTGNRATAPREPDGNRGEVVRREVRTGSPPPRSRKTDCIS